ncbi:hypothetical protein [Azospirillum brasilense]|uniref:hypothetical protein n=1 Tax=Azospirillum brasilense TaxID=192 RepID=UPI00157A2B9C|nr:hypothetical protein [Azospirillum brasilense]
MENALYRIEKQSIIVCFGNFDSPLHSCATSACCAGINQHADDMMMAMDGLCMPQRGDGDQPLEPFKLLVFALASVFVHKSVAGCGAAPPRHESSAYCGKWRIGERWAHAVVCRIVRILTTECPTGGHSSAC